MSDMENSARNFWFVIAVIVAFCFCFMCVQMRGCEFSENQRLQKELRYMKAAARERGGSNG